MSKGMIFLAKYISIFATTGAWNYIRYSGQKMKKVSYRVFRLRELKIITSKIQSLFLTLDKWKAQFNVPLNKNNP